MCLYKCIPINLCVHIYIYYITKDNHWPWNILFYTKSAKEERTKAIYIKISTNDCLTYFSVSLIDYCLHFRWWTNIFKLKTVIQAHHQMTGKLSWLVFYWYLVQAPSQLDWLIWCIGK